MKKLVYEELWIVTGILLGVITGGLVELALLNANTLTFSRYYIYGPAMLAGFILGFWIGPIAWRKIYIEGVRGQKYVVNK